MYSDPHLLNVVLPYNTRKILIIATKEENQQADFLIDGNDCLNTLGPIVPIKIILRKHGIKC
jgi:hypothetical protein